MIIPSVELPSTGRASRQGYSPSHAQASGCSLQSNSAISARALSVVHSARRRGGVAKVVYWCTRLGYSGSRWIRGGAGPLSLLAPGR